MLNLGGPHHRTLDETLELVLKYSTITNEKGCIVFTGALSDQGYVRFRHFGKKYLAHRVILSRKTGVPLNDPRDAHHKCENKACLNAEHLEWMGHSKHISVTQYNSWNKLKKVGWRKERSPRVGSQHTTNK